MRDYEDVGRVAGMSLVYGLPLVFMFWPVVLAIGLLAAVCAAGVYAGRLTVRRWGKVQSCPACGGELRNGLCARCGATMS